MVFVVRETVLMGGDAGFIWGVEREGKGQKKWKHAKEKQNSKKKMVNSGKKKKKRKPF